MTTALVVHPHPDLYGSDRSLATSVESMRDEGWDITVVVPEPGRLVQHLRGQAVPVHIVPFPVVRKSALTPRGALALARESASAMWRLVRLVRDQRPDLVYVNTLTLPHWLLASRVARRPVVCHVHEAEEDLPRRLALAIVAPLTLADVVVANSKATAEFLTKTVPRLRHRVSVVYSGFDFPATFVPPDRLDHVVVVGRLNPRKGQSVLLEAVAMLAASGRPLTLEFVGDTFKGYEWFEDELRQRAEHLGLGDRVTFTGFVDDPAPAYRRAGIVVIPSTVESFGNVAVEALGEARPLVATTVGGLPEIIDDGKTGVLCAPGDPHALEVAIESLLDDPEWARVLATAGAVEVRQRFSRERTAGPFIAALERALDRSTHDHG